MAHERKTHSPQGHLRAKGNLSYPDFVRLVGRIWGEAHPDIPFVPMGNGDFAQYPCVYYNLQMRKTLPNEPKMRYRESILDDGKVHVVGGQRFQNIINFTAITESDPLVAEALIETFEDFMLEFTPVFKELGVSELVYARRIPDSEDNRPGAGVVRRTVSYMVTLEKVISVQYERLEKIVVDARVWLMENQTSTHYMGGSFSGIAPRYYLPHGISPVFIVEESGVELMIPDTNFQIGDRVFLASRPGEDLPLDFMPGYFVISNIIGNSWASDIKYTVKKNEDDSENHVFAGPGKGSVFFIVDGGVEATITDQEFGPSSEEPI